MMNDNNYSSLTDKLIKDGIIFSSDNDTKKQNDENFFQIIPDEDMSHSPFVQKPIENVVVESKKRINNYDLELVNYSSNSNHTKTSTFKTIARFLTFKHAMAQKGSASYFEKFLFTFFPKLYKAKLVKDAMLKLNQLNIDTKTLLDKTIPYGESESRYENLIKYLNYANEMQTKLKRRF